MYDEKGERAPRPTEGKHSLIRIDKVLVFTANDIIHQAATTLNGSRHKKLGIWMVKTMNLTQRHDHKVISQCNAGRKECF